MLFLAILTNLFDIRTKMKQIMELMAHIGRQNVHNSITREQNP